VIPVSAPSGISETGAWLLPSPKKQNEGPGAAACEYGLSEKNETSATANEIPQ
jgi:hypothetical protein